MKARGIHKKAQDMATEYSQKGFSVERICDLLNTYLPEQFYISHGQIFRSIPNNKWVRAQVVEYK